MSISTLHRLDKIVFPSSVVIDHMSNQRWNAGIESMLEHPAGHIYPMFRANQRQRPTIEFSTPQLSILLAACGVGGAAMGATSTYFKKATTTGSVARATTEHSRIVINSLILYWTQIRLPHNGKAEVQCVIAANYDGSNLPFVFTGGSVALAGNLSAGEFFGLGPVAINNTNLAGVQEITINSGVQLVQEGSNSEEFDTFTGIEIGQPSVTVQTKQLTNWGTLGLRGTALDGTDGLEFYARAYSNENSRVADGTSSHIFFKAIRGTAIPMDSNGESNSPITDTCKFDLIANSDSVVPLTITTASAIT